MQRYQQARHQMLHRLAPLLLLGLLLLALGGCDILEDLLGQARDESSDSNSDSTDPLTQFQWHLQNSGQTAFSDVAGTAGQDINVWSVYNAGYTGSGVVIAVVDTGLEIAHEDLAGNVVAGLSHNFATGSANPTNTATSSGDHGTSVGGLSAARAGNGVGGQGVAPGAGLVGYNFLQTGTSTDQVSSLGGQSYSAGVEVFNQSYGFGTPSPFTIIGIVRDQLVDGITNLREGKGAIYVKSAGNGFIDFGDNPSQNNADCQYATGSGLSCQNTNMDPQNAEPYNITVAALDAGGVKSSYSTAGAGVWISAPGGEYGCNSNYVTGCSNYEPAMVTTDQSGCAKGYSPGSTPVNQMQSGYAENASCNYTSTFNGTSSAAPVLSGVVALLLEANPNLTWRDVKHILAGTARQVDAGIAAVTLLSGAYVAEPAWTTNAAGYKFHNWYGFGAVNAQAAVSAALSYSTNLGTLTETTPQSGGTSVTSIPDGSATGATNTVVLSGTPTFIEAVQIVVTVSHGNLGELGIELLSPGGTRSVLLNANNGFEGTNSAANMVLLSNAFYGETSVGTWTMTIVDTASSNTGSLTSWSIKIYGH